MDLSFVRKINGMANGPKTAPIIVENLVFVPLLLTMCQRRNADDIHIIETIIIPVMMQFLLCLANNSQTTDILKDPNKIQLFNEKNRPPNVMVSPF